MAHFARSTSAVDHPDDVVGDDIVWYFERHADGYDRQLLLERRALRGCANLAGPLEGARLVDIATGTGALAHALATRGPRLASITLVDGSPAMLRRARTRLRAIDRTAETVVADARHLPLPDRSADLVSMGFLLHLLDPEARRAVLGEAARLLAPGGRLVAVTHASPPGLAGRLQRAARRGLGSLAAGALTGAGPLPDLALTVAGADYRIEARRHIPGLYWCQAVRARAR